MMHSRFRQFLDLPLELRLLIWKHALRPLDQNRPGAHFFSLIHRTDGDEAMRLSTKCKSFGNKSCIYYHLAAPKLGSSKGSHSWTNNNPSAYLWDFGMWSACRESRGVIKAHYKTQGWTIKKPESDRANTETSVPISLQCDGEEWHFVFHPKRDLVCLQAFDLSTIQLWRSLSRSWVCLSFDGLSLFNFGNVAIAYDPRWNDIKENLEEHDIRRLYNEQSTRGFFIRTITFIDEVSCFHRRNSNDRAFWLIDYNLKRVRFQKEEKKENKIFYSKDQVFTEVDKSLSRRSFSSGEYSSALEFLDNLNILLDGDNPSHCMEHNEGAADCYLCWDPSYRPEPYHIHRQVGVLMCEESA
ncbi:hypothetical protein GGI35DRAFT_53283 [Trichoderma velutinum]